MSTLKRFAVATMLSAAAFAVHAAEPEAEIEAAYQAWNDAFNKGDAAAVASFYTEDAQLLPAGGAPVAADGIEAFWSGLFAQGIGEHTLDLIDAYGEADLLVGTATWGATATGQGGAEQSFGGNVVHVFARQPDGRVKLRTHAWNMK